MVSAAMARGEPQFPSAPEKCSMTKNAGIIGIIARAAHLAMRF
jgi:hypothetical protein